MPGFALQKNGTPLQGFNTVIPAPSSFRRTPESPFAFWEIPAYAGMTGKRE
ncbi:MAG: hypothetical protein ACR2P4_00185 [Gammaproteobacteria bacterium]